MNHVTTKATILSRQIGLKLVVLLQTDNKYAIAFDIRLPWEYTRSKVRLLTKNVERLRILGVPKTHVWEGVGVSNHRTNMKLIFPQEMPKKLKCWKCANLGKYDLGAIHLLEIRYPLLNWYHPAYARMQNVWSPPWVRVRAQQFIGINFHLDIEFRFS